MEEDQAPMHPNISIALHNCAEEVGNPTPRLENKSSNKPGPYSLSEVFNTHNRRNFPQFMFPLRLPGFTRPMDPKSDLDKLAKSAPGQGSLIVNDRDLADQEMEFKRLLSIISLAHWDHDMLSRLRDQLKQGLDQDQAAQTLDTILNEQKEYLPLADDMLTTGLTNSVLRRRDILLKNFAPLDLSEDAITKLRSSDLASRSLLEVPPGLIKEEQDSATQKTMFHLAKSTAASASRPPYNQSRSRNQYRNQNRRRNNYRGRNQYRGRSSSSSQSQSYDTAQQQQPQQQQPQQQQQQQQPQQQQQQQQPNKPYQYRDYQNKAPRRPYKKGGRGGQQGF
jgi:hypothetical protein